VHVEFFESPEALINEKKKLVSYLKKGGTLILNNDDQNMKDIKTPEGIRRIFFGFNDHSEVKGSGYQIIYDNFKPKGITFKIDYAGKSIPVTLERILGQHQVFPALIALSVAISQDINIVTVSQALGKRKRLQPGRMHILDGIKGTVLIDDSYNASPVATKKAIETLGDIKMVTDGRRIAVLGDMLELGKYSTEEHKKIGRLVAFNCDFLVTVGMRAKEIAEGALLGGMSEKNILQFEGSEKTGKYLQNFIQVNDVILVKGSQSIRTERVIEEIMAHPEKKSELLVRQEEEWLKR
jgi:UDP-N-acetylmuramoyl-tripeptide--D-alanyl-D-alanine ligase